MTTATMTAPRIAAPRIAGPQISATKTPTNSRPTRNVQVRPAAAVLAPRPTRGTVRPVVGAAPCSPSAATFRRRRVVAAVFGLALVLVTARGADAVVEGLRPAPAGVETIHYRVHRGDTLWSIARTVAPNDDPRAVVDLLVEANGSAIIRPGDVIDWVRR